MRKLTLRHQIELLVLAVDNRPAGNISATYTLARFNLHFATFLTVLVAITAVVAAVRQDLVQAQLRIAGFSAWLAALNPLVWTMDDLKIIWEAATTPNLCIVYG